MKRMIALTLALMLMACCFAGCDGEAEKIAELIGRWECTSYYTADSVVASFEAMDLYEEEIAMLDPNTMGVVDVVIFNEDKTYSFTSDAAKSMALVDAYYRDAFATFYANRDQLSEVYGMDMSAMGEEEFYLFYAEMYGVSDFDSLIELFVGTADDYAYLDEPVEVGTFRIVSNRIYCTIDGEADAQYITYTVDGDSLDLIFDDSTITYTKAQ